MESQPPLLGVYYIFSISMLYAWLMTGRDPVKQQLAKRRYYEANKDKVKAKARAHTIEMRKKVRAWLMEYLRENHCVDCGETNPVVLEFDHLRDKKFNIGAANSLGKTLHAVQEEVAKCEVRCANCHRRKTYRDAGHTHRG